MALSSGRSGHDLSTANYPYQRTLSILCYLTINLLYPGYNIHPLLLGINVQYKVCFPPQFELRGNWTQLHQASPLLPPSQSEASAHIFKPRREASSQSKFIDVIRLGSDVVTMNKDSFSLKEEWIVIMCNPVVPCRHDLNSYRSFKHAVLAARAQKSLRPLSNPYGELQEPHSFTEARSISPCEAPHSLLPSNLIS